MPIPSDIAAVRGLQKYLQDNVNELEEVYDEWPYFGDELTMPCASVVTVGTPEYTNLMHYIYARIADPDIAENDIIHEVIGQYDARIQVDIWAESKIERSRLLESVTNALNKQYIEQDLPCGLSLTMTDYYNVIARFDLVGHTYIDNEQNSQRAQWRVKMDLLVNYPKLAIKSVPRISEITVINQIDDNSSVNDDNVDTEENFEIN